jgi:hypothetical protein
MALTITDHDAAAIADFLSFPLAAAIQGRRSRRFPLGGEIPDGPLAYTSEHPVTPLSEVERALVLAFVTGNTGLHHGITHHPGYAPHFPNYPGVPGGRTFPSAAGFHTTQFFFTDDTGTYFLPSREDTPPNGEPSRFGHTGDGAADIVGSHGAAVTPDQLVDWLNATVDNVRKLSDERLHLPREEPYLEGHNTWIANHPGSLLVIPVADLAHHLIANIAFFQQNGYGIYDDINDHPLPHANDVNLRHSGDPFPLSFVEQYTLAEASAELMASTYAGHLVLGALGLGGWSFDGIDRVSVLGGEAPEVPGLGFTVQRDDRWPLPNPTGLPGVWETLSRPHVADADEAVDRYISLKTSPGGPQHPDTPGPWKDSHAVRSASAPYTPEFVAHLKDKVRYIDDRFGKIPGTVQTVQIMNYLQVQHLDLGFYDTLFQPGAYLDTHLHHQERWHG